MGLFVTSDGEYKGWLATLLCCCAAVQQDESPSEWSKSRPSTRESAALVTQQPQSLDPPLPPYNSIRRIDSKQTLTKQYEFNDVQLDTNISSISLPPLLPLDLGSSSLLGRRPSTSKSDAPENFWPAPSSSSSIRRSYIDSRSNLVPVKLAPVVLSSPPKEAVASQFDDAYSHLDARNDVTADHNQHLSSYRASRETPFQRSLRQSADMLATRQESKYQDDDFGRKHSCDSLHYGSSLSGKSSAASMRRSSSDNLITPQPFESTSSTCRLKRKHSGGQAVLRMGDEVDDRDAIELNTIVEEQKQDTPPMASTSDGDDHVPAVAPTMQVHARSETLIDIGSAFSRPVTARENTQLDFDEMLRQHTERQPHGLHDEAARDIAHPQEARTSRSRSASQVAKLRSRSSSRVSGWLANIRGASTIIIPHPASTIESAALAGVTVRDNLPLTAAAAAARGQTQPVRSRSSSSTAYDSQANTTPSSPVSIPQKGNHSRSLTAESRIAHTPPSKLDDESLANIGMFTHQAPSSMMKSPWSSVSDTNKTAGGVARSRDSTIAKTEHLCEQEGWPALSPVVSSDVGLAL